MNIARLSDELSVTEQITEGDVESIAALGFKTVFCHRPDNEGEEQPLVAQISRIAEKHGLKVVYLPVVMGGIGDKEISTYSEHYERVEKPVLAYCRSGKRAMTLWSMSQAEHQTLEELQEVAALAKYNYQMWLDAMNLANHKIAQLQQASKT